jgi:hypothetical protein
MERRGEEKSLRWEEEFAEGLQRLPDNIHHLTVISGTPEECFPQAAMFEHVCILPVRVMSTPYSVSSVMGDFLM